jgi:hypothetical protein
VLGLRILVIGFHFPSRVEGPSYTNPRAGFNS